MDTLIDVGQVVGAIVGVLTLLGLLWQGGVGLLRLYRATIGRAGVAHRKLGKLSPDVTLSYFTSILGPPAFNNSASHHTEFVYVDRYFYLQAWVDTRERVIFYTVTSRRKRFRPPIWNDAASWVLFQNPSKKLRLGRFSFSQVPEWDPDGIIGWLGARRFGYTESFYFGNPGHYQRYVIGFTDAGTVYGPMPRIAETLPDYSVQVGIFSGQSDEDAVREYIAQEPVVRFRREARPNLYGVSSPHFSFASDLEAGSLAIGPNADQVRLPQN